MEVVEVCVSKDTWFLRTVERTGRKSNDLPKDYKKEQYARLEGIRDALFAFTNKSLGICPRFKPPIDSEEKEHQAFRISLDLWDDPLIIDRFIETNSDNLSNEDFETAKSWKDVLAGPMFCMETYGDRALMLCEGHVFEAVSYGRSWDDMVPYTPDMVVTSLLPFDGKVVLGGFTTKHCCPMGGTGLIRLNSEYREALCRSIIVDSQQFRSVSREIRFLRQSRGLDFNSWAFYMEFVDDINDLTAGSCRPYEPNMFLWE